MTSSDWFALEMIWEIDAMIKRFDGSAEEGE
jgi:hypothetical protein